MIDHYHHPKKIPAQPMNLGFVAGTLVHTDKGLVPIDKIQVGDMVLSRDENNPDAENVYKRVTSTFKSAERKKIIYQEYYAVDDKNPEWNGTGFLFCTEDHSFWVDGPDVERMTGDATDLYKRVPIGWTLAASVWDECSHAFRTLHGSLVVGSPVEDGDKSVIQAFHKWVDGESFPNPDCQVAFLLNGDNERVYLFDFSAGRPVLVRDTFNYGNLLPTEEKGCLATPESRAMYKEFRQTRPRKFQDWWFAREVDYYDYVYNIEVEDTHTYFVGHIGIWVHYGVPQALRRAWDAQQQIEAAQQQIEAARLERIAKFPEGIDPASLLDDTPFTAFTDRMGGQITHAGISIQIPKVGKHASEQAADWAVQQLDFIRMLTKDLPAEQRARTALKMHDDLVDAARRSIFDQRVARLQWEREATQPRTFDERMQPYRAQYGGDKQFDAFYDDLLDAERLKARLVHHG